MTSLPGARWEEPAQVLRAMVVDNVPGNAVRGQWNHEMTKYISTLKLVIQA
jgi:hypothetical protein